VIPPEGAVEVASAQSPRIASHQSDPSPVEASSASGPGTIPSPSNESSNSERPSHSTPQSAAVYKPSFSESTTVQFSNITDVHIAYVPSSASQVTPSGLLTNINRCVVDMSVSTTMGKAFAGLMLKNIRDSLIVCGHVDGPAHVTGVKNSVIVVACRQLRMHDCMEVDVYLLCTSRPIIEDCSGIRFSPLPEFYVGLHSTCIGTLIINFWRLIACCRTVAPVRTAP
jgi:tubulin-specific chaperone C